MGNCCVGCIRLIYKRRVLRNYTALDTTRDPDQAEDLCDEDAGDGLMSGGNSSYGSSSPSAITENEKLLLKSKNYAAIISSQKTFDEQIDRQLAEQEERLKREEEDIAKLRLSRSQNTSKATSSNQQSKSDAAEVPWTGDDENSEWNVAGGEDDFDMFLDSVAARDKSNIADLNEEEINEDDFVSGFTPS